MSLIKCGECGKDVSDKAECCPNCGCPVKIKKEEKVSVKKKTKSNIFAGLLIIFGVPLGSLGMMLCVAGIVIAIIEINDKKIENKAWPVISLVILFFILFIISYTVALDGSAIETNTTNNTQNVVSVKDKIKEKNEFIEKCNSYSYEKIAREPQKYENKKVKFTGKVIQVSEGYSLFGENLSVTFLISVTKNEYDLYEDNIYCTYTYEKGESKILEGDIITLYGICEGDYSYISVLGANITIPKIDLKYYEINENE